MDICFVLQISAARQQIYEDNSAYVASRLSEDPSLPVRPLAIPASLSQEDGDCLYCETLY